MINARVWLITIYGKSSEIKRAKLPVPILQSWILRWLDLEMSIPSVLGLFSGALIWRLETVPLWQESIEICPFGLSASVSPLNWRLLHLEKPRACNNHLQLIHHALECIYIIIEGYPLGLWKKKKLWSHRVT